MGPGDLTDNADSAPAVDNSLLHYRRGSRYVRRGNEAAASHQEMNDEEVEQAALNQIEDATDNELGGVRTIAQLCIGENREPAAALVVDQPRCAQLQ
jgi:hypothetical protein